MAIENIPVQKDERFSLPELNHHSQELAEQVIDKILENPVLVKQIAQKTLNYPKDIFENNSISFYFELKSYHYKLIIVNPECDSTIYLRRNKWIDRVSNFNESIEMYPMERNKSDDPRITYYSNNVEGVVGRKDPRPTQISDTPETVEKIQEFIKSI